MHLGYLVGVVWMLAAARMLFLPGRIAGSLPVWVWSAWSLIAGFCHVKCLETRGTVTGRCLARDEPCSCSISCGRINSVCRIARDGWITCGDTCTWIGVERNGWRYSWIRAGMKIEVLSLDLLSPFFWK